MVEDARVHVHHKGLVPSAFGERGRVDSWVDKSERIMSCTGRTKAWPVLCARMLERGDQDSEVVEEFGVFLRWWRLLGHCHVLSGILRYSGYKD